MSVLALFSCCFLCFGIFLACLNMHCDCHPLMIEHGNSVPDLSPLWLWLRLRLPSSSLFLILASPLAYHLLLFCSSIHGDACLVSTEHAISFVILIASLFNCPASIVVGTSSFSSFWDLPHQSPSLSTVMVVFSGLSKPLPFSHLWLFSIVFASMAVVTSFFRALSILLSCDSLVCDGCQIKVQHACRIPTVPSLVNSVLSDESPCFSLWWLGCLEKTEDIRLVPAVVVSFLGFTFSSICVFTSSPEPHDSMPWLLHHLRTHHECAIPDSVICCYRPTKSWESSTFWLDVQSMHWHASWPL